MTIPLMLHREMRWLTIFAVLSIGVGLCAGILAERLLSAPAEAAAVPHPPRRGHHDPLRSVSGLAEKLSLDVAQKTEIERIVGEATESMRRLEDENREVESRARDAMLEVLTPEQRSSLESLQKTERDEWRRRELREEKEHWSLVLDLEPARSEALEKALAAVYRTKDAFFRERCRDGARPSLEEVRAFFKTWKVEKTEAIRSALSPAHYAKYEAIERLDDEGGR